MSAIKKATKRITAVAASAAMVSSAVFGASYPSMFEDNGATVVVGAAAAAADTTSAQSIIDSLTSEGETTYKVTSTKSSTSGGEKVSAVRSNNALNYGEFLGNVTETSGFDDSDIDVLEDGRFDNGISDEDYEQTLLLKKGKFNYALKDEVSGVDEIQDGIFYADGDNFAVYTLDLKTAITNAGSLTSSEEDEFIGRELTIMGNEFTVGEISFSANNLNKLVLLGGSNKVSLGEGESTTVSIDGKSYEISVQNVDTDGTTAKVLITVNGEAISIDEFDSDEVGGVSVAVTDLVGSARDSVKGYAEIVIGGQKVTLEDNGKLVKINDEDIDELYELYEVTSDFTGSGIDAIQITYSVSDDVLLSEGDSLDDVLFDTFSLLFEGTNEPDYSTLEFTVNDDDLEVSGTTEDGQSFSKALLHMGDKTDAESAVWLKGNGEEDRIFFKGSLDLTGANGITGLNHVDATNPVINLSSTNVKGLGVLMTKDNEEQYLYEITTVDTASADGEVDLDESLRDSAEEDVKRTEWNTKLGGSLATYITNTAKETFTFDSTTLGNVIAFENEVLLDLALAETTNISTASSSTVDIKLDTADADGDVATDDDDVIRLTFTRDSIDEEFNIGTPAITSGTVNAFVNANEEDNVDGDSDVKTFVTVYGTKVEYDNDEKRSVTIMTPEEQVEAKVSLVFGSVSSDSETKTFSSMSAAEAYADEMEADGYSTSISTETTEAVDFDVSAVMLDSEVSGMEDMIVVGGPAVNKVAAALLGVSYPAFGTASGLSEGEAVAKLFEDSNSVLVYGWSAADTAAAAAKLNSDNLVE